MFVVCCVLCVFGGERCVTLPLLMFGVWTMSLTYYNAPRPLGGHRSEAESLGQTFASIIVPEGVRADTYRDSQGQPKHTAHFEHVRLLRHQIQTLDFSPRCEQKAHPAFRGSGWRLLVRRTPTGTNVGLMMHLRA